MSDDLKYKALIGEVLGTPIPDSVGLPKGSSSPDLPYTWGEVYQNIAMGSYTSDEFTLLIYLSYGPQLDADEVDGLLDSAVSKGYLDAVKILLLEASPQGVSNALEYALQDDASDKKVIAILKKASQLNTVS